MSIAPTIWATYNELSERRRRVDKVLSELERGVKANPALLVAPRLFPEWRALEAAFPNQPLDVSIAVIGAFRGGKSTIINALLGASLLPAAHVATTATITRIRYRPNGYRVCVQYTSQEDETFRLAQADLQRIFGLPFEEAKIELRDQSSRGSVEALLGMYGAIGEYGAVSWDRVAELY
jgi:hypothetical protein